MVFNEILSVPCLSLVVSSNLLCMCVINISFHYRALLCHPVIVSHVTRVWAWYEKASWSRELKGEVFVLGNLGQSAMKHVFRNANTAGQ